MSNILLLVCSAFLLGSVRCAENKINASQPLTLTISPKIWNLLETKAGLINGAVTSITFPEFSGKKSLVKYRVWDGKVDHFSVPKSGVSFQDMNNGVHLSMKNVQFGARTNGRVEIGKKVFGKWVRIARMSGEIKAKTEGANLDIKLTWNDFKFVPTVTMNSDVRVDFTKNLRKLNFLRSRVQKMVNSKVNSEVPKKIIDLVNNKVNPRLQQLKQKLISMGFTDYDIEWTVQNNILRVAIKPKRQRGCFSRGTHRQYGMRKCQCCSDDRCSSSKSSKGSAPKWHRFCLRRPEVQM
ncbi:hypothetical protein OESDEN_15911 [Oesophagostomum dentatum]|uniref:Lipid-binding serum glycoprotein N-terminal domain-containing protein n=1 Tax=Oesophagostomum dentatum TaxID=61180 RepID=A0A0B1SLF9_OESDE|nr:hypothetical protein OESDEN_15911 [Oesophagostomum dentatum]